MRAVVLVGFLAGCSFPHGALASDAPPSPRDAASDVAIPDAMADARPLDAPPCPDDDADGVCNADDDWPCGAKPADPAASVAISANSNQSNLTVSMVNLDSSGRFAVVAPSSTVGLALRLQITDTACSQACVDQLEAGWVKHATNTGNRFSQCLFDNSIDKTTGVDVALGFTVGAPSTAGAYDLRINLGQNFSCGANNHNSWWQFGAVPDDTRTVARLCVH